MTTALATTAVDVAVRVRDWLGVWGYPYLAPQMLLQADDVTAWPVVEVWDDDAQVIRLIVCCDREDQAKQAMRYGRELADESEFGAVVTVAWAWGWKPETIIAE